MLLSNKQKLQQVEAALDGDIYHCPCLYNGKDGTLTHSTRTNIYVFAYVRRDNEELGRIYPCDNHVDVYFKRNYELYALVD